MMIEQISPLTVLSLFSGLIAMHYFFFKPVSIFIETFRSGKTAKYCWLKIQKDTIIITAIIIVIFITNAFFIGARQSFIYGIYITFFFSIEIIFISANKLINFIQNKIYQRQIEKEIKQEIVEFIINPETPFKQIGSLNCVTEISLKDKKIIKQVMAKYV